MFGCIKGVRVPLDGSHKCNFHMSVPCASSSSDGSCECVQLCVFAFSLNLDNNSPTALIDLPLDYFNILKAFNLDFFFWVNYLSFLNLYSQFFSKNLMISSWKPSYADFTIKIKIF